MRILFLTQMLPYPPDAGPKVKTYHVLRYLAGRGHTVTLVSYVRNEEIPHLHDLDSVCERIYPVGLRRSRVADFYYLLRSQLNRRSFLMDRDDLPGMRKLVNDLTASQGFDVIHADQLNMAQFAWPTHGDESDGPARIFDAHNAVWTIVQRMKETATWYLEPLLAEEERRVRRLRARWCELLIKPWLCRRLTGRPYWKLPATEAPIGSRPSRLRWTHAKCCLCSGSPVR